MMSPKSEESTIWCKGCSALKKLTFQTNFVTSYIFQFFLFKIFVTLEMADAKRIDLDRQILDTQSLFIEN